MRTQQEQTPQTPQATGASQEPVTNVPPADHIDVLDTRHIHIGRSGSEIADREQAAAGITNPDVPRTDELANAQDNPLPSSNLGDDGSLGDVDNIDTSATGPVGLPSIGNLDPAGTGNAGNAGLGNSGTALDAALNTQSTGPIGAPVTESLSTPGVGIMNTSGTGMAGTAGIVNGGESDPESIGSSGIGTADSGAKGSRP